MALRGFGRLRVKSRLGPELAPALEAANWTVAGEDGTHIVTWSEGTMRYQSGTTSPALNVTKPSLLMVGRTYQVTIITSAYTSGAVKCDSFGGIEISSSVGTVTFRGVAVSTTFTMNRSLANTDTTISGVSVKQVM